MEDLVLDAGAVNVRSTTRSWRALSIIAALALVFGGVVLAEGHDSAVPKTKIVTNIDHGKAVIDGTGAVLNRTLGFGAPQAQIDVGGLIRSIVCPFLNLLASGPFGAFLGPIFGGLRAAFGCTSG